MTFSTLLKIAFPLALLIAAPACSGDGGGGDGDGDASTGGTGDGDTGGTGGTDETGGSTSGGTDMGTGGGDPVEASGTISLDLDGTALEFEVYDSVRLSEFQGLITSSDRLGAEDFISLRMDIVGAEPGTFDCTDSAEATLSLNARNTEGELDFFESGEGTCTLTVTDIGGPGDPVRGTFSGQLTSFLGESVTASNGAFDFIQGS